MPIKNRKTGQLYRHLLITLLSLSAGLRFCDAVASSSALSEKVLFSEIRSSADLSIGGGLTPELGYFGPHVYLQNSIIEYLRSNNYTYQAAVAPVYLESEIIAFKHSNWFGSYEIGLTVLYTIKSTDIRKTVSISSQTKVGLGDAFIGTTRNELGMTKLAQDQIRQLDLHLLEVGETLQRRAEEVAKARQAEEARQLAERELIKREGDGSEDDLDCKKQGFLPLSEPYKACRGALALRREQKAEKERRLAEAEDKRQRERERLAEEKRLRIFEHEEKSRLAREAAVASDPYYDSKRQCRELGFKDKTERFGDCVLELSRRRESTEIIVESSSTRGDGSADDQTCAGYGYRVGTTAYSDCRLQLDMARRDYEREMRTYEAEKAAYERRVAEAQAEQRRQQQQRQARYGFCVAQCSSQPGATTLGCMSRCGAASAGLPYDPGAPPTRPSGRTTYVINGQIINCRASPSGSIVTCN